MLKASFETDFKSLRSVNLVWRFVIWIYIVYWRRPNGFNLRLTDGEIIIKIDISNITIISLCHLGMNIIW